MTLGILGKKLGMTQLFQEDGTWVPVTVVQLGPCRVLQVKTREVEELDESERTASSNLGKRTGKKERPRRADGYYAVQIGYDEKPAKQANQSETGHAAKSGSKPQRVVKELRFDSKPDCKAGDEITVGAFAEIKRVDVTGTSKGCGFSGAIKRHNFSRQSQSHGNSKSHRRLGGIGRMYSTMKGVPKGKKMPGRHGTDRITVQNLHVVKIDEERNLMYVRGAVPGHRDGYLLVRQSIKHSAANPLR